MVISGEGPCLFGRNWPQHISLDRSAIFNLTTMDKELNAILEANSTVSRGSRESGMSKGKTLHQFFREATVF